MRIPPRLGRHACAALLLLVLVLCQAGLVANTNFFGSDEWTVLSLVTHGVIDVPYAHRPLGLLWALPMPWITPNSFMGFAILYWLYLWVTAALVYWLAVRMAPGRPLLALVAGVVAVVWAPSDLARLSSVERTLYMGITLGMLLAMICYVESWLRRSVLLLVCSILLCFVSGRCYEATLPVLLVTPLVLIAASGGFSRAVWGWLMAFECFVVLAMLVAAQPWLIPSPGFTYQAVFRLDPRPMAVLSRLALQYRLHFVPLIEVAPGWLLTRGVAISVSVFLIGAFLWLRKTPGDSPAKSDLRILCAGGLILATAGYGVLLLNARMRDAWRMQFLSAPGAALLLAGVAVAMGQWMRRYPRGASVALCAWVVAVGTGRTQALQQRWDELSFYPRQTQMLSALLDAVPDVETGTLLILVDKGDVWRASFGFHHAVEYLYRDRAVGLAWGKWAGMFPARFGPEGVASEPWPDVRRAWGARSSFHRYDQVVVIRYSKGAVRVVDEWPAVLPPLPAGARYRPRAQLLPLREPVPERRILRQSW